MQFMTIDDICFSVSNKRIDKQRIIVMIIFYLKHMYRNVSPTSPLSLRLCSCSRGTCLPTSFTTEVKSRFFKVLRQSVTF